MYVQWPCPDNPYGGATLIPILCFKILSRIVFLLMFFGVTFEQYMLSLIDRVIDLTDCTIIEVEVNENLEVDMATAVNTNFNSPLNKVDSGVFNNLPLKIQGKFALATENDMGGIPSDYAIPDKTRGFLLQE